MILVDSHCHLDFPEFDEDRDDVIATCQQRGITQFIVPGVSKNTWPRLSALANNYEGVFPAYGLHPYFIGTHCSHDIDSLVDFIQSTRSIAVGEVGLDYFIKSADRQKQKMFFNAQLVIARDLKLPVILHVRKAHDDVLMALRKYKVKGGVVHAFNGSFSQAEQYVDLGFKLGFGGAMLSPRANHLRALAKKLPLSTIVLETDAPDMRPVNSQRLRNTPLTILSVLDELVTLRQDGLDEIAKITTQNVTSVFDLSL